MPSRPTPARGEGRNPSPLPFGAGNRGFVEQALGNPGIDIASKGLADALVLPQPFDHSIECRRKLADFVARCHADRTVEPAGLNLAGFDIVEVSPGADPTGITSLAAVSMMQEWLGALARSR